MAKKSKNKRRGRRPKTNGKSVRSAQESVVRREISFSAVLKIAAGTSASIGYVGWGPAMSTDSTHIDMALVYEQARLVGVTCHFVPYNFADDTGPTYGEVTGIVAHDPTSQLSLTPTNPFNLSEVRWSRLFCSGSMGATNWRSLGYRPQLVATATAANSFGVCTPGMWFPSNFMTDLSGNTIFSAQTRDGASRTSGDVTVLQTLMKFVVEYRLPKAPDADPQSWKAKAINMALPMPAPRLKAEEKERPVEKKTRPDSFVMLSPTRKGVG